MYTPDRPPPTFFAIPSSSITPTTPPPPTFSVVSNRPSLSGKNESDWNRELSVMTVANIKKLALEFGIKCPSEFNKDLLVKWLSGMLVERSKGNLDVNLGYKLDFSRVHEIDITGNVTDPTSDRWWLKMFHTLGVVSVPVYDHMKVAQMRQCFWNWLTKCNPIVREDNPQSWNLKNVPPSTRGIFKNYIGFEEWMWRGREDCISIFSQLWGTSDLLSSFDGASIIFPDGNNKDKFKNWIHYDQGRFDYNLCSIQGVLHLTNSGFNDGGFMYVENSHHLHKKYMETHLGCGYKWEVIDVNCDVFSGCRLVKPTVKEGHLLLFDSRIAHCFLPSRSNNYRMVMYVCMMPRQGATLEDITKRQKIYSKGGMTGHWCYGPWLSENSQPYTPGRVQIKPPDLSPPPPISQLSQLRRSLIGI